MESGHTTLGWWEGFIGALAAVTVVLTFARTRIGAFIRGEINKDSDLNKTLERIESVQVDLRTGQSTLAAQYDGMAADLGQVKKVVAVSAARLRKVELTQARMEGYMSRNGNIGSTDLDSADEGNGG